MCWVFVVAYEIFNCSIWDLVPGPRIKPEPPAVSQWTTLPGFCAVNYCVPFLLPVLEVSPDTYPTLEVSKLISTSWGGGGIYVYHWGSSPRSLSLSPIYTYFLDHEVISPWARIDLFCTLGYNAGLFLSPLFIL